MDNSAVAQSSISGISINQEINSKDGQILHELAKKVAELAARPVEEEKKETLV